MNEIKTAKFSAIIGCFFIVVGIIGIFTEGSTKTVTHIFIIGGIILMNLAILVENQVKLQSHLTRIEDKIEKRVGNSLELEK